MGYSFQTFAVDEVHRSIHANQTEESIRDHIHGQDGVSDLTFVAFDQNSTDRVQVNAFSFVSVASRGVSANDLTAGGTLRFTGLWRVNSWDSTAGVNDQIEFRIVTSGGVVIATADLLFAGAETQVDVGDGGRVDALLQAVGDDGEQYSYLSIFPTQVQSGTGPRAVTGGSSIDTAKAWFFSVEARVAGGAPDNEIEMRHWVMELLI